MHCEEEKHLHENDLKLINGTSDYEKVMLMETEHPPSPLLVVERQGILGHRHQTNGFQDISLRNFRVQPQASLE